MRQDEKWLLKYNEVVAFIETNKRNPSRYTPEERYKYYNWTKYNKKLFNSGGMKQDKVEAFERLFIFV